MTVLVFFLPSTRLRPFLLGPLAVTSSRSPASPFTPHSVLPPRQHVVVWNPLCLFSSFGATFANPELIFWVPPLSFCPLFFVLVSLWPARLPFLHVPFALHDHQVQPRNFIFFFHASTNYISCFFRPLLGVVFFLPSFLGLDPADSSVPFCVYWVVFSSFSLCDSMLPRKWFFRARVLTIKGALHGHCTLFPTVLCFSRFRFRRQVANSGDLHSFFQPGSSVGTLIRQGITYFPPPPMFWGNIAKGRCFCTPMTSPDRDWTPTNI